MVFLLSDKGTLYPQTLTTEGERKMKRTLALFFSVLLIAACLLPAFALGADSIDIKPGSYGEGLRRFVNSKKKYGYVDIYGNIAIKPTFSSASPFRNGLAHVQVSDGKFALDEFIDTNGKVVFKAPKRTKDRYYGLDDTWMGDYVVVEIWTLKNNVIDPLGYNYADIKGKMLTSEVYTYVGPFSEGYALVGTGSATGHRSRNSNEQNEHWNSTKNGNVAKTYFYIDQQGNQLGTMTWASGRAFKEGMAAVSITSKTGSQTAYWGFIDTSGNLKITPEYASVGDFSNGLAWVSDGEHYGYIDTEGKLVVPMTWKNAGDFDDSGFAIVKDDYHAKVIDKTGYIVLDTEYQNLYPLAGTDRYSVYDGLAGGLIDRDGNVLVPTAYQYTARGKGIFTGTRYNNVLMIYNEFGELITPVLGGDGVISEEEASKYPDGAPCKKVSFTIDVNGHDMHMCFFEDEAGIKLSMNLGDSMRGETFTMSRSNGKTVLFDMDGKQIGDSEWDGFSWNNDYVACIKKGDFYGFVDVNTGAVIVTPQYTSAVYHEDGMIEAQLGNNSVFLDSHARTILPEITKKSGKDAIKDLQQKLADLGYYTGKVNGSFSKQLTEAIAAAQTDMGLEPTGLADSDFQYALQAK